MKMLYELRHHIIFHKKDNLDFRLHAHNDLEIVFMLRGQCHASCGNTTVLLQKGDVFIAFPNQPHQYENSKDVDAHLMIIPAKQYLAAYHHIVTKTVPKSPMIPYKLLKDTNFLPVLQNAIEDFSTAQDPVKQGYVLVLFGKLLTFLQLQEQTSGTEGTLRKILEYLNNHYTEALSRKALSMAVGYNESYLSHLFTETMRTSIPEYINTLRIDDACRLLQETNHTVSQISSQLGFTSIRNFNRVFLKRMGITPSQYRNSSIPNMK